VERSNFLVAREVTLSTAYIAYFQKRGTGVMIETRQTVSKLIMIFAFLITLCVTIHVARAETIFKYDFEEGWGNWYSDNGVWEIGTPTAGPSTSYGGIQCAATVLSGDYPSYTDSRLISPTITLSTVSGDEELALRFWHWFSYSSTSYPDYGYTQISTYDNTSGTWSDWETIGSTIQSFSGAWSSHKVNITSYAGKKARIAFYHTADDRSQGSGWYIDDIEIIKKVPEFTGDFESGWGDWYSDNGVWEIGTPTAGPSASYGGTQCAATVLSGDYPSYTDSRLISPTITLSTVSGDEELALRFWHWFSYSSTYYPDYGYTQISTYDRTSGTWSAWETIGSTIQNISGAWSSHKVNITSYAGKKARIAFYHTADKSYQGSGWYIDDVEITGITTSTTPTPVLPPTVPPAVTPSPSPVIDTGAITGWVLEATTLGGISGATVSTNPGGYSALTEASGYYTIENIPPDTYTVTATASGYNSSSQSGITIYADEIETVNFQLQNVISTTPSPTPIPPTTPSPYAEFSEDFSEGLDNWYLVVYNSAGGSDNDSPPVIDNSMGLSSPSLDVNGDGWCGNGVYSKETFNYTNGLIIEWDMYVASGYDWNWGSGGLSNHLPNLTNQRNDGAYIDNDRCDTDHLAGIKLMDDGAYNARQPSLSMFIKAEDGTTDSYVEDDAEYLENDWHHYKIHIKPDGYVEFYIDDEQKWVSTKRIDESIGELPILVGDRDANGPVRVDNVTVESESLSYISAGTIAGWVLDATTLAGIPGATVSTSPGGYSAITDTSGYYTIDNVPGSDTYNVPGSYIYTVTATATGYNSSSQSGIIVYANDTAPVPDVNFQLQYITTPSVGTGYIIGSVIDNDTKIVISGAIVTTDNGGYSATTDTNGSYLMTVDAGSYTVTASANGYESASQAITVEANSITTANFNLELIKGPAGFITGTVSDADTGKVIEGVTVTTDAGGYAATTDKGGVYQLTVSTGEYTMTATANGYETAQEDVTVVENAIATVNFSLTPVVEPGVIFGSVEDEYGDPFQGVEVTLSGDGYSDESETDEDGDYAFYDVPAGDYTLSFKAKGYGTEELKISIEEGELYEAKTIEMETEDDGLGLIYGYVYDIYGDPIESAKVKVKGVASEESYKEYTDGDGFFEFDDMESGTYKISAKKKRYKKTKTTVTLKAGQEKYVEMELRKSSRSRSDNVEVGVVDSGIGL